MSTYKTIESYKKVINKTEEEIREKELIKNSLLETLTAEVKSIILPLSESMLDKAWIGFSYASENKNNDDKEEVKKCIACYKIVKESMMDHFFDGIKDKVELINIIGVGLHKYAYNFHFKINDKVLEIQYPLPETADPEHLVSMYYGKYSLSIETSPNCWSYICSSYYEEDINMKIKEILKEDN